MARKFSIADICFYPTLFENKNKGTMPLAQFYFHSLEAQDSAFYTPRSLAGVIRNWSKISKLLIMSQKEVYILLTGNISMIYESKYKKFHIFHMQQAVGKWKPKINSEWVFFSRPFPNCSSCVYNCVRSQLYTQLETHCEVECLKNLEFSATFDVSDVVLLTDGWLTN